MTGRKQLFQNLFTAIKISGHLKQLFGLNSFRIIFSSQKRGCIVSKIIVFLSLKLLTLIKNLLQEVILEQQIIT